MIEGRRRGWKEKRSDDGTCDGTECAWMGKDNEGVEMVLMIVHIWHYAINKKGRKSGVIINTRVTYKMVRP